MLLASRKERTDKACEVSFKLFQQKIWQRRNLAARSLPVGATVIHPPSCLNTRIVVLVLDLY
jgi:hypothetical protein